MRLLLAASALIVIGFNPTEPDRYVETTYTCLILYALYSLAAFVLLQRRSRLLVVTRDWSHWIDIAWYSLFTALSSGTNSVFFFGFLFSTLVASFRWGFRSGVRAALASATLFLVVSVLVTPASGTLELNRLLLRAIYLLVIGYMMASFAEGGIQLHRRLALLKEIATLSNPRFGVERTVASMLERIGQFFGADVRLLLRRAEDGRLFARYAARPGDGRGEREEVLELQLGAPLLAMPDAVGALYASGGRRRHPTCAAIDTETQQRAKPPLAACEQAVALFDCDWVLTVPVRAGGSGAERLYVGGHGRGPTMSDLEFLDQVVHQCAPVVENIRLLDSLASNAATRERRRLAFNIHDSIIQPYVALQLGLLALRKAVTDTDVEVAPLIDRIVEMSRAGLADLRKFVASLHGEADAAPPANSLVDAIEGLAARFQASTGISVRVDADRSVHVGDRLAAEVFQIVSEALSNISRHTSSDRALVSAACAGDRLHLRIENERGEGRPVDFTPRSLSARAAALGGKLKVDHGNGRTGLLVEIPL
jgi:signal transduction histidine kinase